MYHILRLPLVEWSIIDYIMLVNPPCFGVFMEGVAIIYMRKITISLSQKNLSYGTFNYLSTLPMIK